MPTITALFQDAVLVIWEWDTIAIKQESCSGDSSESGASRLSSEADVFNGQHTLKFKCIGVTKETIYQDILRDCKRELSNGRVVLTRLHVEQLEEGCAVAVELYHKESWCRVGYIVEELKSEVKQVMDNGSLVSVKLSSIRYVTYWRSGLGYYASIEITKVGSWSRLAQCKRSSF